MSSTSKACEIKYGKDTVRRAKTRLAQRRRRDNYSIKKEQETQGKILKELLNKYFEQKKKEEFKDGL